MVRLSINVARLRLWALLAPMSIVQQVAAKALEKLEDYGVEKAVPFEPLKKGEREDPGMDVTTILDWIDRNDFLHESEEKARVALMGLAALAPKAPVPEVEEAPAEDQQPEEATQEPANEGGEGGGSEGGESEETPEEGSQEPEEGENKAEAQADAKEEGEGDKADAKAE